MRDGLKQNLSDNLYNNLVIDVPKLYKDYLLIKEDEAGPNCVPFAQTPFHRLYRSSFIPLLYRRYAYHALRRMSLDLSWFDEFKKYWTTVLKGRPLWSVYDLFFLKNWYRIKFLDSEVPDTDDSSVHLNAYQRPEVLYQLLHLVCRESVLDQAGILQRLKMAGCNIQKGTFLEFGCATAPVTTAFFEFWKGSRDLKVYFSDIQTLAFHYAAYRFRKCTNAIPLLLRPEHDFILQINDPLDAIFCITVFEHLNKPLDTVRVFYDSLKHGGYLLFDYIKSEGDGFDTLHGVRQRNNVLDFLSKNFELVYGKISKETSMGLTIVRKE